MIVVNSEPGECEGGCSLTDSCKGEVVRVEVKDHLGSWGRFWYCKTAISKDKNNGFEVTEIPQGEEHVG